jgi:hypothetical protein
VSIQEQFETLPESVRTYAEFVFSINELSVFGASAIEDQREEMHKKMAEEYGLPYEDTKDAVCHCSLEFGGKIMSKEAAAVAIDQRLRRIKAERDCEKGGAE